MKKAWYIAGLIIGLLSAWLFVDHISGFAYPDYFYNANPGIEKFVGTNVVSRWADFSYFTYHTLIFFSLWSIGLFVGNVCGVEKVRRIFEHEVTVVFVLGNCAVTTVLYTVFELASGNPTFGLYANTPEAIHNLGTNLLAHYAFPVFAWVLGLRVKTCGQMRKVHFAGILAYLTVYYLTTKITGAYCYAIEWYPYPIFDGESLWELTGLPAYERWKGTVLLVGVVIVLAVAYLFFLRFVRWIKRRGGVMQSNEKKYALITGATGGLGTAFVHTLAEEGYALLLTGRSAEKLSALQAEIQNAYGVEVRVYPANLDDETSRMAMQRQIQADGYKIDMLVNVAGADIQKGLAQYTQEKVAFQCRVNFEAALSLSRAAIELKGETLEIINISSVSGIYPMPYFAIYSATKGALTSFSMSLREEMKGKNIRVTAVLPGAMPTREDIKEQIKGQGLWGKMAAKSPSFVARKSLVAVAKNKKKYIPGFWNKVMNCTTKLIPLSLKMKFIAKRWSKISKDAF